jgi:hypothetical protein
LFQQSQRKDFLAEVTPVQRPMENGLINLLKLPEGKLRRKEVINDIRILELGAKPFEGEAAYLIMVIGKLGKTVGGKPLDISIL